MEISLKLSFFFHFVCLLNKATGCARRTPSKTTQRNLPQLSQLPTPTTTISSVWIQTERNRDPSSPYRPPGSSRIPDLPSLQVVEVNEEEGTIEFVGANFQPLRKIWVLQSKGGASFRNMTLTLESNGLAKNARLSILNSRDDNGEQMVWNGTQKDLRNKWHVWGNVVVVMLTIKETIRLPVNTGLQLHQFKLKFETTRIFNDEGWLCSSKVLRGEGHQVVSFPLNNTKEYPRRSLFTAVIAPANGKAFQLTLKYLDIPGSPPDNCRGDFSVYFFQESLTEPPYRHLFPSAYRPCGRVSGISEPLGNSSIAIVQFYTYDDPVGMGFRIDVN